MAAAAGMATMNCITAQQMPNREGLMAVAELRSAHRRLQELLDAHPIRSSRTHPHAIRRNDLLDNPCSECSAIVTARHAFLDACNAVSTCDLVQPMAWWELKDCFYDRIVHEDLIWRREQPGWRPWWPA